VADDLAGVDQGELAAVLGAPHSDGGRDLVSYFLVHCIPLCIKTVLKRSVSKVLFRKDRRQQYYQNYSHV